MLQDFKSDISDRCRLFFYLVKNFGTNYTVKLTLLKVAVSRDFLGIFYYYICKNPKLANTSRSRTPIRITLHGVKLFFFVFEQLHLQGILGPYVDFSK